MFTPTPNKPRLILRACLRGLWAMSNADVVHRQTAISSGSGRAHAMQWRKRSVDKLSGVRVHKWQVRAVRFGPNRRPVIKR